MIRFAKVFATTSRATGTTFARHALSHHEGLRSAPRAPTVGAGGDGWRSDGLPKYDAKLPGYNAKVLMQSYDAKLSGGGGGSGACVGWAGGLGGLFGGVCERGATHRR